MSFPSPALGWTQTFADATSMVNLSPATGDDLWIQFKRALNENGWTTTRSSTGSSNSQSGDVIGTTTANLAASNAYFNLNSPDGKRSFLVQRGLTSRSWKLVVVGASGWNADGTNANIPTCVGTSGDAIRSLVGNSVTPALLTTFLAVDTTYYLNIAVQTVAPYAVYWFGIQTNPPTASVVTLSSCLFIDPIYFGGPPNDPDPCIYYAAGFSNTGAVTALVTQATGPGLWADDVNNVSGGPRGWIGKNASGGAWSAIMLAAYQQNAKMIPFNTCASLFDNADVPVLCLWARGSSGLTSGALAPYGVKGFSTTFRFPSQSRAPGELGGYTAVNSNDGMVLQDVMVPWPSAALLKVP